MSGKRIWVAGHRGMVGRGVVRALEARGNTEILTVGRDQVDLRDAPAVRQWLKDNRPDAIVVAAAKVGGILANATFPAEFLNDNIVLQSSIIEGAHRADINRLLFLGSTCIYPKHASQPIKESALLTGPLEETNEWYAIAKIAGIKLCQAFRQQYGRDYISAMPTNLYGPHDNFDLKSSHVLPALIRKAHEAKLSAGRVTLWGSGTPRREFMHVDDLSSALLFLLERYSEAEHVNVGIGDDVTIKELAQTVANVVGYKEGFDFDPTKPDGTPRKCTDNTKLRTLGWAPKIELEDGVRSTYDWFQKNAA
jgi:GDP-L-fucose synthase